MNLTNFFDKTYCINLDRRPDKWQNCISEFEKYNITNVTRWNAIDHQTLPPNSWGAVGGNLALIETNILILNEAISNNYNSILILEDDVEFNDQILDIKNLIKYVPTDWDMLYFGGNHNTEWCDAPKIINDKICKLHNTYTTHCVALNKKVFQIVLDRIEKRDGPIDVIYAELQKQLNVYCFYPWIATQRSGLSDIVGFNVDYKSLILIKYFIKFC